MSSTYKIMIWSQPILLFAGAWYTSTYLSVQNTGIRNGWGMAGSVGLMTFCLHLSIWATGNFVQRVRVNAIKKVGTGGKVHRKVSKSTVVSSAGDP